MKLYLSHSSNFDYEAELYQPLKQSLAHKYDIFFPHDVEHNNTKTKNIIATCDLLMAETSFPATGQGIELGWADASNVPILCFYRTGATISGSLQFVCDSFLVYSSTEDMLRKLDHWLQQRFPATK